MALKRGYKQTEAGVIPEDWEVSAVGDEFLIQLGKMLDVEKNVGMPKPFLGNRAVQWGRIDLSDIGVVKLTSSDLQRFRLRAGDLLVCEGGEVGRCAIWREPIEECYYQKALHRLRPKRGYNINLMLHVLRRLASSGLLLNFVTQTSIAHLPKDKFETVPIPLPPNKAEQEAIAEALGDADALIETLEQLLAKKRQIKQGAMQELLTGKRRLPGFEIKSGHKRTEVGVIPEDWEVVPLSTLLEFRNGVNAGKEAYGTGVPFINVLEIITKSHLTVSDTPGRISLSKSSCDSYRVRRGDLIFNRTSETQSEIGLASVFLDDEPVVFGGFVIRARPILGASLHSEYAGYALRAPSIRRQLTTKGQGAIRTNIGQADLRVILFPLPSLPEQRSIAAILMDIDIEIAALEAKLTKARQLKQGMMQELLTGRIRLV